ncbi:MAG: VOC family protein [Chloroflexi bacterium]|nr:VOC family protein [Chloroflexota bacterium]
MTRYYGIAELAIVVSDIHRAVEFYVDLLGMEMTDIDMGERARIVKMGDRRYLGLWEPGERKSELLRQRGRPDSSGHRSAPGRCQGPGRRRLSNRRPHAARRWVAAPVRVRPR